MDSFVTIAGNLTADAQLRYTQQGKAVANLSVAVTPRRRHERTGEWEDGATSFYAVGV
jgi:single-strand DNA-binding protein